MVGGILRQQVCSRAHVCFSTWRSFVQAHVVVYRYAWVSGSRGHMVLSHSAELDSWPVELEISRAPPLEV